MSSSAGLLQLSEAVLSIILSFLPLRDKLPHLAPVSRQLPPPPAAFHNDSLHLTRDMVPLFLASKRLRRSLCEVRMLTFVASQVTWDETPESAAQQLLSLAQLTAPPCPDAPSLFSRLRVLVLDVERATSWNFHPWALLSSLFPSPAAFPALRTLSISSNQYDAPASRSALGVLSHLHRLRTLHLSCCLDMSGLLTLLTLPLHKLDVARCRWSEKRVEGQEEEPFVLRHSLDTLLLPDLGGHSEGLAEPLARYFAAATEEAKEGDVQCDGCEAEAGDRRPLQRLRLHCHGDENAQLLQLAGRIPSLTEVDLVARRYVEGRTKDTAQLFLLAAAERSASQPGMRSLSLNLEGVAELHTAYTTFFTAPVAQSLRRVQLIERADMSAWCLSQLLQLLMGCSQLTSLDISSEYSGEEAATIVDEPPQLACLHSLHLDGVAFQPGSLLRLLSACPSLTDCRLCDSSVLNLDELPALGQRCPLLRRLHLVLDYQYLRYDDGSITMREVTQAARRLQLWADTLTAAPSAVVVSCFPCLSDLLLNWEHTKASDEENITLDAALSTALPALLAGAPLRQLSLPLALSLHQLRELSVLQQLQLLSLRSCEAREELQAVSDPRDWQPCWDRWSRWESWSVETEDGAALLEELMNDDVKSGEYAARFYFHTPATRTTFWTTVEQRVRSAEQPPNQAQHGSLV